MNDLLTSAARFFTPDRLFALLRVSLILLVGLIGARLVSTTLVRLLNTRLSTQHAWLMRRLVWYGIVVLTALSALRELGVNLSLLVGAAGILTVAIGFASQTSASNLISGIFLIAERPFVVGDVIKVGDLTGEVIAIDLLSVKIRTFDNLYARVPNESLIKSQITNMTHFAIRRVDMTFGVSYKEEIARVRATLLAIADTQPLCLQEPPPVFVINGFVESAINLQFSVWVKREHFLELRNSLYEEIKRTFEAEGIELPSPQRSFHPGAEALRVELVRPTAALAPRVDGEPRG